MSTSPARALGPARLLVVTTAPLLLLLIGVPASAQVGTEPRQRPFNRLFGGGPPVDPNRTRTDLTLSGAVFGGYDDSVVGTLPPGLGGPIGPSGGDEAGNSVQGSVGLRYSYGRPARNFGIDANAYSVYYPDATVGFTTGGSLGLSARTRVGRADDVRFTQLVAYAPVFSFAPTATLVPIVEADPLPQTDPGLGIFERSSWASNTGAGYRHELGRRASVELDYEFDARMYEDSPDPTSTLGDTTSHLATVQFDRTINRRWSVLAEYGFFHSRPTDADGVRPVTDHNVTAGLGWTRDVSRTRSLHVQASAGAQRVNSTLGLGIERRPFDYWAPSGQATVDLDLSRNWNVSANYRRNVTVVPEVTSESFLTDAIIFNARGLVGSRLELLFSGGRDWSDAGNSGSQASLDNTNAGVQAQIAISRMLAATVTYTYFDYAFQDVSDLPAGFAADQTRNTIRVGLSVWLPLIGRYPGERSRQPAAGSPAIP